MFIISGGTSADRILVTGQIRTDFSFILEKKRRRLLALRRREAELESALIRLASGSGVI
ncbi:MAG: hypothetical protein Q4P72_05440 [Eubacteriales bacterium]|nr:hypothetical protein [Eubacteriales bacterium]